MKQSDYKKMNDRLITSSESEDLKTALLLLCDVIDQAYGIHNNDVKHKTSYNSDAHAVWFLVKHKTSYNSDAHAVWFLAKHGYTEIIKGAWPATKYIEFKFTDKYYSERF